MILCVSLCESCWLVDKLIGVLLLTGYLPYETASPPNIERWCVKKAWVQLGAVSAQKSGNFVGRRPFDLFTFSHKSKQLNCVRSHGYANFCVWFDWGWDTEFFSVCDDHSGRRWQNKSIIIRYWLKYCQFSFCRLTHAIRVQWPFSHQSHEKRSKAHTHTVIDERQTDAAYTLYLTCTGWQSQYRIEDERERERCVVIGVADICVIVRFYNRQKQVDHTPNYMCISPRRWTLLASLANIFRFIDSRSAQSSIAQNTSTTWCAHSIWCTDIDDTKNNGLPIDWVSCGRTLNRRRRKKAVSSGHNKWQSNLLCFSLRICFFSNPVDYVAGALPLALSHISSGPMSHSKLNLCARAQFLLLLSSIEFLCFVRIRLRSDFCRKTIVPNAT